MDRQRLSDMTNRISKRAGERVGSLLARMRAGAERWMNGVDGSQRKMYVVAFGLAGLLLLLLTLAF